MAISIYDEQLKGSANRFDLIRLFAAYLVIFGHSGFLFKNFPDDFYNELTGSTTAGQLAVSIFFVISGFLICGSAYNSNSLGFYLFSRATRLYPAALLCSLITVFIIGTSFTHLDTWDYLSDGQIYKFIKTNTFLFSVTYNLPGVFTDNVASSAINGSLWTIPYEIKMYLFCAVGVFLLRRQWVFPIVALVLFAYTTLSGPLFNHTIPPEDFSKYSLAYYFFVGSAIYILRHRFLLHGAIALALCIIYISSFNTIAFDFAQKLFLPYAVIFAALSYPRFQLKKFTPPDISYGVYIYGFPIQQSVSALFGETHSLSFCIVVATCLVTILATISWYAVEKPTLANKRKLYRLLTDILAPITTPIQQGWKKLIRAFA
tara:strand:- start:3796 stop:4917 length:1122 start_codon:yes stop_codon:yes gene_type:complete